MFKIVKKQTVDRRNESLVYLLIVDYVWHHY